MKVIHLVSGLRAGGAEHMVLELCRQSLGDPGMEMEVAVLGSADEIRDKFVQAGIPVCQPAVKISGVGWILQWRSFTSAVRYVLYARPDIIHAHLYHGAIAASIVKLFSPRTKVVFTLHNMYQPGWFRRLLLFLLRPLRNVDLVFPGTHPAWFQKKRFATVPNGVDVSRFQQGSEKFGVFTFLFAGRLDPQKNPLVLLDMVEQMNVEKPFQLLFAGNGRLKDQLQLQVKKRSLQQQVKWLGNVNDITTLINRSHCVLLPSLWEGMPLIILEAGAAGVPLLTTPAANATGILNSSNSFIADVGDFAVVARQVMDNYPAALHRASRLKQLVINEFSAARTYELHCEIYDAIASDHSIDGRING